MHATNPQPISSDSLASELITRHLRATSAERPVSPAVIALMVALIVLPLALLLLSSAS
jgi:hypothetical protein